MCNWIVIRMKIYIKEAVIWSIFYNKITVQLLKISIWHYWFYMSQKLDSNDLCYIDTVMVQ